MQGSNYNLLRGLITEFQNFSDPIEMAIPIPKRHCFIENCLSPSSRLSGNDRERGDIFPPRCAINSPIMDAIHYMYWPKVWRWRLMYFLGWVGRRGIEKQEVKVCSKQWRNEHNRRMKEKEKTNERRRTSRGGREQKKGTKEQRLRENRENQGTERKPREPGKEDQRKPENNTKGREKKRNQEDEDTERESQTQRETERKQGNKNKKERPERENIRGETKEKQKRREESLRLRTTSSHRLQTAT